MAHNNSGGPFTGPPGPYTYSYTYSFPQHHVVELGPETQQFIKDCLFILARHGQCCEPPRRGHFNYSVGQVEPKRRQAMIEVTITNEQKIPITVNPVTAAGHPAQLDGAIVVTVQSGAGTVEMVDARTFKAVSSDTPGDTVYLIEGDADLGAGVQTISDIVTLHVEGALAANLGLTVGVAEPK